MLLPSGPISPSLTPKFSIVLDYLPAAIALALEIFNVKEVDNLPIISYQGQPLKRRLSDDAVGFAVENFSVKEGDCCYCSARVGAL
jgi:hypothetical protein